MVCARTYRVGKALTAHFPNLFRWVLCGSSIRTPRELDPPVSFTRHRLFFALFCPKAACILFCAHLSAWKMLCLSQQTQVSWENWPAAAICNPASRSGRTWYLGFWQQLAFYCALVRELCFTVRGSLLSLTDIPRKVTGIKAMVHFNSPLYPALSHSTAL